MGSDYALAQMELITHMTVTDADGDMMPDTPPQIRAAFGYIAEHGIPLSESTWALTPAQVQGAFFHDPNGHDPDALQIRIGLPGTREQSLVSRARQAARTDLEAQRGLSVGFTTAASLVHELIEARDERRLLNLQKKLARLKLLIIDELGFVPLSKTGAEFLFEVFSQRYERGSVLVTTNLPFDEWTEVFGSERLTGALLDRLTHRVHILEMNGESYRLKQSRQAVTTRSASDSPDA